jgi:undecaprenyl-phosphate 4-deoxy-4-formamido-L-arabinose transferase
VEEKMRVSLVSPVYNEEKVIEEFVRRATQTLSAISEEFEIILVNDGSTDQTRILLDELKQKNKRLRVVNLSKNSGQHAATVIGLHRCTGDFVFLMDSDLQTTPENMQQVFALGQERKQWDVISGYRMQRSGSLVRSAGSKIVSRIINTMTRTRLKDPGSTFLLMTRNAVDEIINHDILAQNLQILMGYLKLRILETAVAYQDNRARKSSYRFRDLSELLILALLNFTTGRTTLLVLLAIGVGLFCLGSLGVGVLILQGIIQQSPLPTNLLIFFSVQLLLGLQFNFLGIIAFKLERVNKNLDFRKTIIHELHEDN